MLFDREVQVLPTMVLILERLYMLLTDEVMLALPGTSRPKEVDAAGDGCIATALDGNRTAEAGTAARLSWIVGAKGAGANIEGARATG